MADVVIISDSDSDEELVPVKPPPKHHRIIDPSAIASVPIYSSKIINDSDNDEEIIPMKPPLKRRRIIDPSSIASVPIYSNKVNTCLQLKATAPVVAGNDTADSAEVRSQYKLLSPKKKSACQLLILTDSEEEVEYVAEERNKELEKVHSPSPPPPPGSPPAKVSKHVSQKIREINRKLGAVCALLSQSAESGGVRHSRRNQSLPVLDEHDDDIIISPNTSPKGPPTESERNSMPDREIPLKFRCRTDLHKIPLFSSAPLSEAVNELSRKLNVQPFRILLLRNEMELPTHLTANELGLSIADIIDCVVLAENDTQGSDSTLITVKLQGKEKDSKQEYSLHREAPLGSILSQYLSGLSRTTRHKVQFHFDGSKINHNQTPSQLDMEDGDIIEVWM